jgi:hypothetical protein
MAVVAFLLTGCDRSSGATDAPMQPAASIVMTSPLTGHAVLPSGSRWIVVGTADGWRTVTNQTPTAVPTDGGLALSAGAGSLALGVLPFELLTVSPVLQSTDAGRAWSHGQLPGGLLNSPDSLSIGPGGVLALVTTGGGQVVGAARARGPWHVLTTTAGLAPQPPHLVTVSGFGEREVALTASGVPSSPLLFVSSDAGATWQSLVLPAGTSATATALTPCEVGGFWFVPVVSGSSLRLDRAASWSGPWSAGAPVPVGGHPVVACGPQGVWVFGGTGNDDLHVADVTGLWTRQGTLTEPVTSAAVVSPESAFATTSGAATRILKLRLDHSLTETPIPLPSWVATVGGPPMRS